MITGLHGCGIAMPGANASSAPIDAIHPHAMSADEVLLRHNVDPRSGLMEAHIDRLRARHGLNRLPETSPARAWQRFLRQFSNTLVLVLIGAALISGIMREWTDTIVIIAIVLLNALLGFFQENKAEVTLASLRKLSAPRARVLRQGVSRWIAAADVVPGDIVELDPGAQVPADARLISQSMSKVDQSALTGESLPAEKNHAICHDPRTPLADRSNMVYAGTHLVSGHARGVVTATGLKTELGHIHQLLSQTVSQPTPLQRRLARLGTVFAVGCTIASTLVFTLQLWRGELLSNAFMTSLSLAVAAIPEGMPAIVTLALAIGTQRMARQNALIRSLPSVETLGSVTVICTDKTGTLTHNQMAVTEIIAGNAKFTLEGDHFAASQPDRSAHGTALCTCLNAMAWCNNATINHDRDGHWSVIGEPTEAALLTASRSAGIDVGIREDHLLHEIPFDPTRKMMTVAIRNDDGSAVVYVKGAPDVVLTKCSGEQIDGSVRALTDDRREQILRTMQEMADRALRVLAMASRPITPDGDLNNLEGNLVFAGLVGMTDPPRDDARLAVQNCQSAGIHVVMITGDHPVTARSVARQIGLNCSEEDLLTGPALDRLTDDRLASCVDRISIYARVTAAHKMRIVRALKSRGHIVAMTGDGVNDAPALRAADIGIAMGITGTDVTKEASTMILLDDNFATIVSAVELGRAIVDNIRKFMQYLVACNIGEVLFILVASLLGWPVPLLPMQILWMNLVTDGLPALALGVEPPEPEILSRKPAPPNEPLLSRRHLAWMFAHGVAMTSFSLTAFFITWGRNDANLAAARTVGFCTLCFAQLAYALTCRSQRFTLPQLGVFSNRPLILALLSSAALQILVVVSPFFQSLMHTSPLTWQQWLAALLLALGPVTLVECLKLFWSSLNRSRGGQT